ncbi:MAG: FkbM family methyltransferase [Syntrophobacteraceae bacterium]
MKAINANVSLLFDRMDFPPDAFFAEKALGGRKIIIYGAGEGFHWVLEILMRHYHYRPSLVLDRRFKRGDTFEGFPAFSPEDYRPSEAEKRETVVIVCVGKREYHAEIVRCLEEMGFCNILLMMDVYEIHNPLRLPAELEEKGFGFYLERKEQILDCLDLFEDEESREIYCRALQTHMERKPVPLPARPAREQYFPEGIPLSKGYARFVNCGAYDGDTVRLLNAVRGKVDELVCFEAEPFLFERLAGYLRNNRERLAQNIVAMPCAAYNREGLVRFISGGGLGSRVSDAGDTLVQAVALDHVLPGFSPTFICMDVEGAEPEVLRGAEGLIRESRPDLGVCVYHAPHHLWEVPRYLHGLGVGYRFYLRNYTGFTAETVLYATA